LPTIAYFLGIAVRMFFNDHTPSHFYGRYQGFRARILISDGEVIDGRLPVRVARLVKEWTALRRDVLMQNWHAAQAGGRLEYIAGLEDNDD
jgi:hypothetical protein